MNLGLDKDDAPYRFNFAFVEPQESLDSIFEISPKQTVMGPRETQVFTVTFNPAMDGKGPGVYRSIVMASPTLS